MAGTLTKEKMKTLIKQLFPGKCKKTRVKHTYLISNNYKLIMQKNT